MAVEQNPVEIATLERDANLVALIAWLEPGDFGNGESDSESEGGDVDVGNPNIAKTAGLWNFIHTVKQTFCAVVLLFAVLYCAKWLVS